MAKLSFVIFIFTLSVSLQSAHGFQCYQCESKQSLANCTKTQVKVKCSGDQCCTFSETGQMMSGITYKYFVKGCKERKHNTPSTGVVVNFNTQCCGGRSLCNISYINQASFFLVSSLVLLVSKILLF